MRRAHSETPTMASNSTDRVLRGSSTHTDLRANALRALAMDGVQQANSGHPGAPMGMAEMAVALWAEHLRHNPVDPQWSNRDRFVLSNGHASMLLYALLHLSGYALPLAELKQFRKLHSKTPGHPEVHLTPGVETTTGPLGQGLSNAVGMALAEKLLADEFNRPDHRVVDHHSYVFLGDGCLMEGISHEACSLAGTLRLHKLIALYDDNGISIDGAVDGWFDDDTAARFRAYGWHVIGPVDGHQVAAIGDAIAQARMNQGGPTLILCRTTIGAGSPAREGTAKAHGEPLGNDEIAATRKAIGWLPGPFEIPDEVAARWDAREAGVARQAQWQRTFDAYAQAHPALAAEYQRRMTGQLPAGALAQLDRMVAGFAAAGETLASRKASQKALAVLAQALPELLGGSADLTASNLTDFPGCGAVRGGQSGGRHINYGVREFGMAAIMNGIALHGGFIPYGGTFLTFSDYSRNAIRMAALMKLRVVHVFTHDSIGLGEDGPTHQSIEHAASLRLIPNLDVWRPGDTAETAVAWTVALGNKAKPTALLLSRQNISYAPKGESDAASDASTDAFGLDAISKGAYVLAEPSEVGLKKKAQAVIIATGSEVQLALKAQELLATKKISVRVVSMPSNTTFDAQSEAYKRAVLPAGIPRIAVEMGVTGGWWKYGCAAVVGIDTYGESAPAPVLFKHFGFTPENVAETVQKVLGK